MSCVLYLQGHWQPDGANPDESDLHSFRARSAHLIAFDDLAPQLVRRQRVTAVGVLARGTDLVMEFPLDLASARPRRSSSEFGPLRSPIGSSEPKHSDRARSLGGRWQRPDRPGLRRA